MSELTVTNVFTEPTAVEQNFSRNHPGKQTQICEDVTGGPESTFFLFCVGDYRVNLTIVDEVMIIHGIEVRH